jgi:hypothetical protein
MMFPMLGDAIAQHADRAWIRRLVWTTATLVLAAVTVIATQLQLDWLAGRLAEVMQTDPTPEGVDWTSVRDDLRARGLLPSGALVAALNWRDAGKIGYALGPNTTMLCLNADSRQFGFAHPLGQFAGRDVLVLAVGQTGPATQWFQSAQALPRTSVRLDGRILQTVTVLQGTGLVPLQQD